MKKYIIIAAFLLTTAANANIFKFHPPLGVFDTGIINIEMEYATCNDSKWDSQEIFPNDIKIFYALKCVEIESNNGFKFYHLNIIIDKVLEDGIPIYGPFIMTAIAKDNGTLSTCDGVKGDIPFSIQLLSKFIQPLAMCFYYPGEELNNIVMWDKKYNWPRKKDYDITFNGSFYVKNYDRQSVYMVNDVFFCMPDSKGFDELGMSNVNGHLTSKYVVNQIFSSIDSLDARFTLRYDYQDDRMTVFFNIKKESN